LLARSDAAGAITELIGHFGRNNPQVGELQRDPRALVSLDHMATSRLAGSMIALGRQLGISRKSSLKS
jgi:hypothetical protein